MKKSKMFMIITAIVMMAGFDVQYKPDSSGIWGTSLDFSFIQEADAKRGGFRGGGSRGFRSYSKPKRSSPPKSKSRNKNKNKSTKNDKKIVKTSQNSNTKSTTKAKPRTRFVNNTQRAVSERNSKKAYSQAAKKFQKPPVAKPTFTNVSSAKSATKNSKILSKARQNDSRTYYSRRDNYYSGWNAPTYVYAGAPSYGFWDAMFLWHMMSTPTFGYHHSNNEDYKAWRAEAEQLAESNKELQAKLDKMDAEIAKIANTTPKVEVDPNYLPSNVPADIALSPVVMESFKPSMKICTGLPDGTYQTVVNMYKAVVTNIDISVVGTFGSLDNLKRVTSGQCDAALVQRDAYWVYIDENPESKLPLERVNSPYREYVHMVCNVNSGVGDVRDLTNANTLYVGPNGSGSSVTWNNFVAENEKYSGVKVVQTSNDDARQRVSSEEKSCSLYVGSLASKNMRTYNQSVSNMKLVDVDDPVFLEATDPTNEQVYKELEISAGHYANLQKDFFNYTETMTVPVDLVVSQKWAKENNSVYHNFVNDVIQLKPKVVKLAQGN